jgi:hypothetical protein
MKGKIGLIAIAASLLAFVLFGSVSKTLSAEPPVVDAHLGSCSADFTVTDKDRRPVYNAKIEVTLRYGLMGMRKMRLEVGTDAEGKARIAGLPEKPKRPLEFEIIRKPWTLKVEHDPSAKCSASFAPVLE